MVSVVEPLERRAREPSRAIYARRLREDIEKLRKRGLVPLAIADVVGVRVDTVSRILREQGYELPSYLTLTGRKTLKPKCPHCRQVLPSKPLEEF